ncbi:GNAT domain-containing protein [Cokeromyces recurvatus]|uniref:GNAT domain-containing protein n=1 Tax=Cokeromyces recurvatus TaxID=90255 RepID=UPI00221F7DB1|nr:GNAT domain-containing protein [Cokeromyces recurvatus]KAI7905025.1 GNAT domain-containing protein [Cokeromyces recurvatus]
MRLNENTVLIGEKVALVPYRREHVPKYHEWMKSPFLQEMTASEPLTLEEEYDMQRSWHEDEEKLTFIITTVPKDSNLLLKDLSESDIKDNTVMIGDVNIFFNDPDNDRTFGEIEVMIAEPEYRRTGRGKDALKIMMCYAMEILGVKTFQAKISLKNEPSINLFKSKFCYYEVAVSSIFQEISLEWTLLEPAPAKVDEYGNEIDSYGSKATLEQRQKVQSIHKELIEYWKTMVRTCKYDVIL